MESKQPSQKQIQPKKPDIRFIDYAKDCGIEPNEGNYRCWQHGYGCGVFRFKIRLLQWCNERKKAETENRPDVNIHKKTLIETWDQIIHKLKGR